MDTEALPPIPTPPGQRWREFRISILPPFIFIAVLAALFMLWTNFVQPVAIVGMVETNAVNIVTTQAGLLTTLAVNRFDDVTNGQVIGEVAPYDPEQLKAELAAIASTAAVKDAQAGVLEWGKLDNAIAMRLNLIAHQISVDAARIKFVQASNVVAIDERLRVGTNYVVTDAAYQAHLADREALKTEWLAQAKTVQLSTNALDHIEGVASNIFAHLDLTLKEDVLKQQKQLLELQKPLVFKAPIDGKITAVLNRAGERVVAGAPLVTISSTRAQQIVAFVRQPIKGHNLLSASAADGDQWG